MKPQVSDIDRVILKRLGVSDALVSEHWGIYRTEGWDSLMHIEIISEIEELLDIHLTEDEIERIETVEDLRNLTHREGK